MKDHFCVTVFWRDWIAAARYNGVSIGVLEIFWRGTEEVDQGIHKSWGHCGRKEGVMPLFEVVYILTGSVSAGVYPSTCGIAPCGLVAND